ncbi:hypothetical protein niasHS_010673 [Heterodera schachtii]|uniref:Uncharacterized protein n=1 Tax=Heterodera schachtii TaxID=97005 RepID=A0ABD2IZE7_HETSC
MSISTRLNMYEMRERIWIREKLEFEKRHKETIENWQRSVADLRAQSEIDLERTVKAEKEKWRNATKNGATKGMTERNLKDLQTLFELVKSHHKIEVEKCQMRILELENLQHFSAGEKNIRRNGRDANEATREGNDDEQMAKLETNNSAGEKERGENIEGI